MTGRHRVGAVVTHGSQQLPAGSPLLRPTPPRGGRHRAAQESHRQIPLKSATILGTFTVLAGVGLVQATTGGGPASAERHPTDNAPTVVGAQLANVHDDRSSRSAERVSLAVGDARAADEVLTAKAVAAAKASTTKQVAAQQVALTTATKKKAAAKEAAAKKIALAQAAAKKKKATADAAAQAKAKRAIAVSTQATAVSKQDSPVSSGDPQSIAKSMLASHGWSSSQWYYLDKLWTRESSWRVTADNPTSSAYGIPQALPGNKMASAGSDWRTNPTTQIRWGLDYIDNRYGSPQAAWAHETSYGWY